MVYLVSKRDHGVALAGHELGGSASDVESWIRDVFADAWRIDTLMDVKAERAHASEPQPS